MVFVLTGFTACTVLAGADFGAGLWALGPGGGQADTATTRDHTGTRWARCGKPGVGAISLLACALTIFALIAGSPEKT